MTLTILDCQKSIYMVLDLLDSIQDELDSIDIDGICIKFTRL